jgi:hypothetical protein
VSSRKVTISERHAELFRYLNVAVHFGLYIATHSGARGNCHCGHYSNDAQHPRAHKCLIGRLTTTLHRRLRATQNKILRIGSERSSRFGITVVLRRGKGCQRGKTNLVTASRASGFSAPAHSGRHRASLELADAHGVLGLGLLDSDGQPGCRAEEHVRESGKGSAPDRGVARVSHRRPFLKRFRRIATAFYARI